MDSITTLNEFLEYTELSKSKGLFFADNTEGLTARESHLLEWGKSKIKADALFALYPATSSSCIPLVYFRRLEEPDSRVIAETHKLAWNMGHAPLLMIVVPGVIKVYSTYNMPKFKIGTDELDENAGLIDTINFVGRAENWRQEALKYRKEELLSGRYWERNKGRFNSNTRVERTLLTNLSTIRDSLMQDGGLSARIVHRLLGRAIFIQYLQDRKDNNGKNVFPADFFSKYSEGATNFVDVLKDREGTYSLFQDLEDKFKGNIFPINYDEERVVKQHHLGRLADFISGDIHLNTKQVTFWPFYSFDAIPIEFISNLYEKFFHYEEENQPEESNNRKKQKAGTFYTPHRLVEFLMDEVLPWDGKETDIQLIDPACGSGIFLVEAYRRLIARWQRSNPCEQLTAPVLKKLLTKNIFGIDLNPEAVRVAAFSLYLTLCDYLEPRYIWNNVTFPSLDANLNTCDFFELLDSKQIHRKKYDIVIGNPPWESKLSKSAMAYLKKKSRPIGDKQIAQAFLWGATDICKDSGEIVLLAPSKGLLFNNSTTNKIFRKQFFSCFDVKTIVNFSTLRRTLFAKAIGPSAAIFYNPRQPCPTGKILYCSPKPCYSPEDSWHFVIEPQDIAFIPLGHAMDNQHIWKAAMWGGPRDWELIQKLAHFPNLYDICDRREWTYGEGFIRGNKKEEASWLTDKSFVPSTSLSRYVVDEEVLLKLEDRFFERPRKNKRNIFNGPHLLISQSPKGKRGFIAALLRNYAVFTHSILGISSNKSKDEGNLGAVCLTLTGKIILYYAMLTGRKWLVERDELETDEFMSLPIPYEIYEGEFKITYNELTEITKCLEKNIDYSNRIIKLYNLTSDEMILVDDALKFSLDLFYHKENSVAIELLTKEVLMQYGQSLCKVMNESFGRKGGFSATMLSGDMPMIIAHITLNKNRTKSMVTINDVPNKLVEVIEYLDKVMLEEKSKGIYVRRSMKYYVGTDIYIVKRNQRRFWTQSAAFRDADEVYADIMNSWKG